MSNNNHIDHFKDTILSALPETILAKYIAEGLFIEQSYAEGKIIHLEGDPCIQVEIVLRGKIIIERIGSAGDQMLVREFYTGDIIGANLVYSSLYKRGKSGELIKDLVEDYEISEDNRFYHC